MTRIPRTLIAVASVALLTTAPSDPAPVPTVAASATAPGPLGFGALEEVVRPGCRFSAVDGDAAAAPDGTVRGFVAFRGGRGPCGGRLWFVERRDGGWGRQLTPYAGQVLAVAADGSGTYVLYRSLAHGHALRVARRTNSGRFTAGRRLSADPAIQSGAIVAAGGRWWAVWSQASGDAAFGEAGGEGAGSTDLYQATVVDGALVRRRVTTSEMDFDGDPALLLRPGGKASVAWGISDYAADLGILGLGTVRRGGRARLGAFELTHPRNFTFHGSPDLALDGRITHLIWERQVVDARGRSESHVVTANDRGGWGPPHTFRTGGFGPRIAASGGNVVAGWTTGISYGRERLGQWPSRVFAAERSAAGTWTEAEIGAKSPHPQRLLALTSARGEATALMAGGTRVYARTQRSGPVE